MFKRLSHFQLHTIIMIFIMLLAFFVRLYGITEVSLWTDEGHTIYTSGGGDFSLLYQHIVLDRHPPLYFAMLTGWQNIAGSSLLALRFVAVVAGILTTAIVYRIGADWFSATVGMYAATILALLDLSIYYTQEIRHYSWLLLFTAAITWIFLRYLKYPTRRYWVLYLVLTWAIMLTHYFGVFVMMIHVVFGLFFWSASWRKKLNLIGAWVGAAILYVPWIIIMIPSLPRIMMGVGGFPGSFATTSEGIQTSLSLLFDGHVALLGGVYLIGVWHIITNKEERLSRLFLVSCGGGLLIFLFVFNLWRGVLSARMLVFLTPALAIISSYGLVQFAKSTRHILFSILIILMLVTPAPTIQPRIDALNVGNQLQDLVRENDLIILELGWTDLALQYHLREMLTVDESQVVETINWWEPDIILRESQAIIPEHQSVWVIQWLHAPIVLPSLLDNWNNYQLTFQNAIYTPTDNLTLPPDDPIYDPVNIYLFQQPDLDTPLQTYDDLIQLDDLFVQSSATSDESIPVDLWWSRVDDSIILDYSVGVYLLDDQQNIVTQIDVPVGDIPSTQWVTNENYYQRVMLDMPTEAGTYNIIVRVYHYTTPSTPLPTTIGELPIITVE